jgi:Na+/glutamate symporter
LGNSLGITDTDKPTMGRVDMRSRKRSTSAVLVVPMVPSNTAPGLDANT